MSDPAQRMRLEKLCYQLVARKSVFEVEAERLGSAPDSSRLTEIVLDAGAYTLGDFECSVEGTQLEAVPDKSGDAFSGYSRD